VMTLDIGGLRGWGICRFVAGMIQYRFYVPGNARDSTQIS
jgi:hypothetical protein